MVQDTASALYFVVVCGGINNMFVGIFENKILSVFFYIGAHIREAAAMINLFFWEDEGR